MLKDLLKWFLLLDDVVFIIVIPAVALAFFAGLVSFTRGVSRWT